MLATNCSMSNLSDETYLVGDESMCPFPWSDSETMPSRRH